MIYTTYFAKLKSLPSDIAQVSICGKAPDWFNGFQYKKLAPKYNFFKEWQITKDNNYYIRCFNEQVLNMLSAKQVYQELVTMTQSEDIALICYERSDRFCHRHLVREWLNANGIPSKEW